MTPEEKAQFLVHDFTHSAISDTHQVAWAKMNAIKCVKHIINAVPEVINIREYWIEVKEEIEKI